MSSWEPKGTPPMPPPQEIRPIKGLLTIGGVPLGSHDVTCMNWIHLTTVLHPWSRLEPGWTSAEMGYAPRELAGTADLKLCTQLDRRTGVPFFMGPIFRGIKLDATKCMPTWWFVVTRNFSKKKQDQHKARVPIYGCLNIDQLRLFMDRPRWGTCSRQRYTLKRQRRVFFDVRLGNSPPGIMEPSGGR